MLGGAPGAGCVRRGMDPTLVSQGVPPTLANTVEERFIGRLTPGSNRFNGAYQAGQGIDEELQSGAAFRVSPRVGAVYVQDPGYHQRTEDGEYWESLAARIAALLPPEP